MTKEGLEKEAYEWTEKNISVGISMYNPSIEMYCGKAYKDGAEPREKRIEELEEKLANADYQLEGRDNEIRELEAQIEKMKCCEICMYKGFGRNFEFRCSIQGHIIKNPFEEKCDKWEIEK